MREVEADLEQVHERTPPSLVRSRACGQRLLCAETAVPCQLELGRDSNGFAGEADHVVEHHVVFGAQRSARRLPIAFVHHDEVFLFDEPAFVARFFERAKLGTGAPEHHHAPVAEQVARLLRPAKGLEQRPVGRRIVGDEKAQAPVVAGDDRHVRGRRIFFLHDDRKTEIGRCTKPLAGGRDAPGRDAALLQEGHDGEHRRAVLALHHGRDFVLS
ncbi:MAG TPA: hypothetical protein VNO21_12845, partial [Polyangiaceae bacterium]|nr:hypothetical protein [Polyangiaceae bacterium]